MELAVSVAGNQGMPSQAQVRPYRILFFVDTLGGGVTKVVVNLIRHLDPALFRASMAVVRHREGHLVDVPEEVAVHFFDKRHVSQATFDLARLLRQTRPDLMVSAQDHLNVVALLARRLSQGSTKTVASVHTTPAMAFRANPGIKNRVLKPVTMRLLYPTADGIHAVSQGAADGLADVAAIPPTAVRVIHNPIVDEGIEVQVQEAVEHGWFSEPTPVIVSVGRLSKEKGYPYLLQAVARIRPQRQVRLVIVGEGPQRAELESLARELGIAESVDLIGYRENPFKYLARAQLFVLSSLWEGLPGVLVEAMACGAPVVATDCRSGPSEIITNDAEGLLVPTADVEALAEAMLKVLSDATLADRMQGAGRARAQDFHVTKIAREYEQFFLEILEEDAATAMAG
jgi:glycosyltransferase involved in cell wall biosynthesis